MENIKYIKKVNIKRYKVFSHRNDIKIENKNLLLEMGR